MDHPRMQPLVARVQQIIQYTFNNPHVCWEALQVGGSGIVRSGGRHFPQGNKRLAILGDEILETVVCQEWYRSGTAAANWTQIRNATTANANLYYVGLQSDLDQCINTNPQNPVSATEKVMATVVEGIIGAVFEDGGLSAVRQVARVLGLI